MSNMFDYRKSLNGIKANLFDIYENQEQIIGLEENENIRNQRLNKFVQIKDLALMLIDSIEDLYVSDNLDDNYQMQKLSNPKIPEVEEESKILDLVEEGRKNTDTNGIKTSEDIHTNDEDTPKDTDLENEVLNDVVDEGVNLDKYYLNCDESRVNFAYVPPKLFEKIKLNGNLSKKKEENKVDLEEVESDAEDDSFNENDVSIEESDTENSETSIESKTKEDGKYIKIDEEKPRGIIVRSDQYMKLALSRHRQEGVLKEARLYRINEVKRKRRENQKIELEKAKVDIDI